MGQGGYILGLDRRDFLNNDVRYPWITIDQRMVLTCLRGSGVHHIWELPGNYPVFPVVMVIYHYVERIWRILVTNNFLYNIYNH